MINRRSILALIGGAAATPAAAGVREASKILGIDPSLNGPMPQTEGNVCSTGGADPCSVGNDWWGSSLQIAMDARRMAFHETGTADRYSHMKSWSPAFKRSVVAREIQIEQLFEAKCRRDQEFVKRILGVQR